jgi:formylglycine-generating enzyme required for sulfatase activity
MVLIPAGSFMIGDADTASYRAQPPHLVTLSAYYIDRTEVTVAAWRGCSAPDCGTPDPKTYCNWTTAPGGLENHPINCVYWYQARAYCQSRGGDLPTEAQWEYAARGPDSANHIYPWGNEAPSRQLCWDHSPAIPSTCEVGLYPSGDSPFGVSDMAGNLSEWTLDRRSDYTSMAATDPMGPSFGSTRVIRGGNWGSVNPDHARAAYRIDDVPDHRSAGIGFRCVRGVSDGRE